MRPATRITLRASRILPALVACFALQAQASQTVTHGFCWIGAEGYRVEGTITYPTTKTGILTEFDLTEFTIAGFHGGQPIGTWALSRRGQDDSVVIRFDADTLSFPMGGDPLRSSYQAWNAGGDVTDCGNPGFGFNGGNRAQDVCVNGQFIDESGIDPATPLAVGPAGGVACGPLLMGRVMDGAALAG